MSENIENFLRQRNVAETVIEKFWNEKIDDQIAAKLNESQLQDLGLDKYGDRVAFMTFATTLIADTACFLKRIKSKLCTKKGSAKWHKLSGNSNAKKEERQIEIGWLNIVNGDPKQVKQKCGGGTRSVLKPVETTVKELLQVAKTLFFPDNVSAHHGHISGYRVSMVKFDETEVTEELTIYELYKSSMVRILRLYLCTEKLESAPVDHSKMTEAQKNVAKTTPTPKRLKIEPTSSNVEIVIADDESQEADESKVHVEIETNVTADTIVTEEESLGEVQEKTKTEELYENESQETITSPDFIDIADLITFHNNGIILNAENGVAMNVDNEVTLSEQLEEYGVNPLSDTVVSPVINLKIHRGHALKELEDYFVENDIDVLCGIVVHTTMVLPNGDIEAGEDFGGVFRDMITEYWNAFYDRRTEGNTVKVPALSPKMDAIRWRAVACILMIGYYLENYVPVQLSPSFLKYAIKGEQTDKFDLIDEYMKFIPDTEATIISKALIDFNSVDLDDIIYFFDIRGQTTLPSKMNIKTLVAETAHKEMLQMPSYVAECWREKTRILPEMTNPIYETHHYEPTFKKIWPTIMFEEGTPKGMMDMVKKYIKSLDDPMLGTFLRFATGADIFLKKQIKVNFVTPISEFRRSPTSHTCGCVLEVPNDYSSYAEFRQEFNDVLKSNVWVMDIA